MHKFGFFARMALRSLKQNSLFYRPFAVTASLCVAMCYIMRYLSYNDVVATMRGASYVALMLGLGSAIMVFMVCWIMAYADGFVMRRRKRELALYNILGLEKKHIARILGWETLFLYLGCTAVGIAGGALFSKLVLLGLLRLVKFDVAMGFEFSIPGARETAICFAVLFLVLYLYNLRQVQKASPIELLHSDTVGEKEPKSRWLLALFGLLTLGGGYALSYFTISPLMVVVLFFVAVALVIIGTHCLFGAGSVVVLKALRKNKAYYYQPRHFTAVSGLIYRMNQNARGLANICILATTVLVSVATTVCLYAGVESAVTNSFPNEIVLSESYAPENYLDADPAVFDSAMQEAAAKYNCPPDAMHSYDSLSVSALYADGRYTLTDNSSMGNANYSMFYICTAADYAKITGQPVTLSPGEVLACGKLADDTALTLGGMDFTVKQKLDAFPKKMTESDLNGMPVQYLVVADRAALYQLWQAQGTAGVRWSMPLHHSVAFNPGTLNDVEIDNCANALVDAARQFVEANTCFKQQNTYVFTQAGQRESYYNMNGSFVFLGLFLAILFMIATVLIIYYKQLSEGYDDRERFVIMQKVGMSTSEVRATIGAQVRLVFFLPVAVAALHVVAAFPMLMRLVSVFGINDSGLFIGCIAVTLAVFTLCYVAVYVITAKKYYHIVRM